MSTIYSSDLQFDSKSVTHCQIVDQTVLNGATAPHSARSSRKDVISTGVSCRLVFKQFRLFLLLQLHRMPTRLQEYATGACQKWTIFIRHRSKYINGLASIFIDCDQASDLWEKLNKNFVRQTVASRLEYFGEFLSFEFGDRVEDDFTAAEAIERSLIHAKGGSDMIKISDFVIMVFLGRLFEHLKMVRAVAGTEAALVKREVLMSRCITEDAAFINASKVMKSAKHPCECRGAVC
ncbi:hypothetical protein MP228_010939 [Amoeboaphelidium protococcarum]|nr:hypothetical protein MP228_010939 [Amoeboaphelidium protococcarum]